MMVTKVLAKVKKIMHTLKRKRESDVILTNFGHGIVAHPNNANKFSPGDWDLMHCETNFNCSFQSQVLNTYHNFTKSALPGQVLSYEEGV